MDMSFGIDMNSFLGRLYVSNIPITCSFGQHNKQHVQSFIPLVCCYIYFPDVQVSILPLSLKALTPRIRDGQKNFRFDQLYRKERQYL